MDNVDRIEVERVEDMVRLRLTDLFGDGVLLVLPAPDAARLRDWLSEALEGYADPDDVGALTPREQAPER